MSLKSLARLLLPLALSATPMLAGPVLAGPPEDMVTLDILPGWRTDRGTQMAGLRLTLAPGWKTYWRAPGDAGIPPAFSWQGSENVATAEFHWPVPQVFHLNGMRSIGYSGQVVIPIEITPVRDGNTTRIAGEVELGVCDEICIPVRLPFSAELPESTARDVAIATALVDRPLTENEAAVADVTCEIEPSSEGIWFTARMKMPSAGAEEVVVVETGDPQIWVSEADADREGDWLTARVEMIQVSGQTFALDRSRTRITVLGSDTAVDIQGCRAG